MTPNQQCQSTEGIKITDFIIRCKRAIGNYGDRKAVVATMRRLPDNFSQQGTKVCRYSWHSAGSLG